MAHCATARWAGRLTPDNQPYRLVGWSCLLALANLIALKGKGYYIWPVYPVLYGAGAVVLERFRELRWGVCAHEGRKNRLPSRERGGTGSPRGRKLPHASRPVVASLSQGHVTRRLPTPLSTTD